MDEKLRNELAADIEGNIEPVNQEYPENPGEPDNPDKFIYMTVSNKLIRENVECKDGKKRTLISIPKGTTFNGKDVSGYIFFPPEKLIHENKFVKGAVAISYPPDFTINLMNKEEKLIISPAELKAALAESFKEWRKARNQEKAQDAPEKDQKKSLNDRLAEAKENVDRQDAAGEPAKTVEKSKEASL